MKIHFGERGSSGEHFWTPQNFHGIWLSPAISDSKNTLTLACPIRIISTE